MPRNTSVTLGEYFEAFISRKIAEGRFQSVSEAVRAGLRCLEEEEAKLELLRTRIRESRASPLVEEFDPEQFLAELRAKATEE